MGSGNIKTQRVIDHEEGRMERRVITHHQKTLSDNLKLYLEVSGMDKYAFASILKLHARNLSQLLTGSAAPGLKKIDAMEKNLGVPNLLIPLDRNTILRSKDSIAASIRKAAQERAQQAIDEAEKLIQRLEK